MCLAHGRRSPSRRDDGSLMLVFLIIIVISAMTLVTVAAVVTNNRTTRHAEAFQEVLPQADVGVQKALFAINNGAAASLPTASSPALLTTSTSSGRWWVAHTQPLEYVVYSTSTQRGVKRTVSIKITDGARFPVAAFADTSMTLRGSNSAVSYDHRYLTGNTGHGFTGSNGSVTFDGNASADGVKLYDYTANPNSARCSGGPCAGLTTVGSRFDISSESATSFISSAIAACQVSGTLSAWVATANGGIVPAGRHCYSSMDFDTDTTIQGTDENPTIIYVTGNVSVNNHTNVNFASLYPSAQALQIFTLGDSVAIGNHSNVGAAIWAPHAGCGGNPSNAQADIYGSLICASISNQGGWGFHYDDALNSLGTSTWSTSHYAEN